MASNRNVHDQLHSNAQRGATLAEYALLVALIAVVAVGALKAVGSSSSDTIDEAARRLGATGQTDEGGGGSGGGGGGGGGGGDGATTTTTPPTTSSTTTTTAPPSTTSTTAPPQSAEAGFSNSRSSSDGRNRWKATTTLNLEGTDGQPLVGSVVVTLKVTETHRNRWGSTTTETRTKVIEVLDGSQTFSEGGFDEYALWQRNGIDQIKYEVVSVQRSGGGSPVEWDGRNATAVISQP